MATSILSQDILAICLLVAEGDINLSLEEVMQRVENFQDIENRHFGISTSDFRGLFQMLICVELRIKKFGDEICDIKLRDIITDVLKYHDTHFNDEGEHWIKDNDGWSKNKEYWFGYNEISYQEKLLVKQEMESFFEPQNLATLLPDSVKKFMEEIKITDATLFYC